MYEAYLNEETLIPVSTDGYETGLFPQLEVYSKSGTLLATINAFEVGTHGLYHALYSPVALGDQSALFIPYTDAGHTIKHPSLDPPDPIKIHVIAQEIDQQGIRDAMKLAPTGGAIEVGSIDEALDIIETDTAAIETLVSANLDAQVSLAATAANVTAAKDELLADHALIRSDITGVKAVVDALAVSMAAMNNLSAPEVAAAIWDASMANHVGEGTFGQALIAAAGDAGLFSLTDGGSGVVNIPHDANNNPISLRVRIFPSEATWLAATAGASSSEGEILTLRFASTSYSVGSLTAAPTILNNLRRGL